VATGIEILDKYTAYYAQKFAKEGLNIEKGEIASELGEVYVNSLKNYDPKNDGQVKFSTYVIQAFKNQMKRFRSQYLYNCFSTVSLYDMLKPCDNLHVECESEDRLIIEDDKREIMKKLNGRELIIFNEMVNISTKVRAAIASINCMHEGAYQYHAIAKGGGVFVLAINLVYGYSKDNIRYNIRNIRSKSEKVLDFATCNK
jgi:hypothetical protein